MLFFMATGSLQEKKVLDKVYRKTQTLQAISSRRDITSIPTTLEEKVKLFIDFQSKSSLILGQDIPLSIEVFNYSDREKATDLVLGVQSLHYNGVPIMQLWKEKLNFIIKSNEGKDSAEAGEVHPVFSLQKKMHLPVSLQNIG